LKKMMTTETGVGSAARVAAVIRQKPWYNALKDEIITVASSVSTAYNIDEAFLTKPPKMQQLEIEKIIGKQVEGEEVKELTPRELEEGSLPVAKSKLDELIDRMQESTEERRKVADEFERKIGFKLRNPDGFNEIQKLMDAFAAKVPIQDKEFIEYVREQARLEAVGTILLQNMPREPPKVGVGNYCGPNTPLVYNILNDVPPTSPIDEACLQHDIDYTNANTPEEVAEADSRLIERINKLGQGTVSEKLSFENIGTFLATLPMMLGKTLGDKVLSFMKGEKTASFSTPNILGQRDIDRIESGIEEDLVDGGLSEQTLELLGIETPSASFRAEAGIEEPTEKTLESEERKEQAISAAAAEALERGEEKDVIMEDIAAPVDLTSNEHSHEEALLRPEFFVTDPDDFKENIQETKQDNEIWKKWEVYKNPNDGKNNPIWSSVLEDLKIRFRSPLVLSPSEQPAELSDYYEKMKGARLLSEPILSTVHYQKNAIGVGGLNLSYTRKTVDDELFKEVDFENVVDDDYPDFEDLFMNAKNTNRKNRYGRLTDIIPNKGFENQRLYID